MRKYILILLFILPTIIYGAEFKKDIALTDGVWTDSRAYSTFAAALAAVPVNKTIMINKAETVSASTYTSAGISIGNNGSITVASGQTLTIYGLLNARPKSLLGSGSYVFSPGTTVKASWFNSLYDAIDKTANSKVTLIIDTPGDITSTISVGSYVTLRWEGSDNVISCDTGIQLQNIGKIEAGQYKLFDGAGDFDFVSKTHVNSSWFDNLYIASGYIADDTILFNIDKTETMDHAVTIPSTVTLTIDQNHTITTNSLALLIQGYFDRRLVKQCFSGSGVVFSKNFTTYPEWWGSSGSAIQYCITATPNMSTIEINSAYVIDSTISITNKSNFIITGKGSITITNGASDTKCFNLVGTITNLTISDLTLVGEGNNSYTQYGIGAASGQTIDHTYFKDLKISDMNVGISINANTSGSWTDAWVENCYLKDIVGTGTGQGYGIHVATGANEAAAQDGRIFLLNNTVDNASRHSIYIAHTKNVSIIGGHILNHRSDVYDGSIRAALSLSRSEDISVKGVTFTDNYGGCINISSVRSEDSDYESKGIVIDGCVFDNFPENAIYVGYLDPDSDYPISVKITNNVFRPAASSYQVSIRFAVGYNIDISNNIIGEYGVLYDTNIIGIQFYSTGGSYIDYDTYTKEVFIHDNSICLYTNSSWPTGSSGSAKGIYFDQARCEGVSHVRCAKNDIRGTDYAYAYYADPDNPNIGIDSFLKSYVSEVTTGGVSYPNAGCVPGSSAGYVGTSYPVKIIYANSQVSSKETTDNLWDLTGVSTSAAEYCKVLLCLDTYKNGVIIVGNKASSGSLARLPMLNRAGWVPVGFVWIDPSYSGGAISADKIYNLIGPYSQ